MPYAVLVVDDDREIASVITELLREEGYAATCAFDGQQALDYLDSHEADLLISDIRMPRLDGIELLARLRKQGWSRPVVLMSAVELDPSIRRNVTFLRKPFDIDDLVAVVEGHLENNDIAP